MRQNIRTAPPTWETAFFAIALSILWVSPASAAPAACEDLAKFPLTGGKITSVVVVAEGTKIPLPPLPISLISPAGFCRVAVTLTPTSDSAIMAEVWLPDPAKWNGNFLGSGNGGFGGSVSGPALDMRGAVAQGYATAGNDLGHEITSLTIDGTWVLGHPEKVKDFAYRADHVTAEFAKALIAAYYGRAPQFSYFRGCSNGGHEALMEAQKYPADYDGIVAGAPANAWTRIMTGFLWNEAAQLNMPQSEIPKAKLAMIQDAVMAKCDALDGVKDGIINDPRACHFDPKVLLCTSGDAPNCLTHPQFDALSKIYDGPVNPDTGERIHPGFPPGSEGLTGNWDTWIIGPKSSQSQFANQFYGNFVMGDSKWNYRTFNFATDLAKADAAIGSIINSDSPDLGAFAARGGKLILFQGWADAAITPWGTIKYYQAVQKAMGADQAHRFVRLFMAPGMMHCGGGPGPNSFDAVASVAQWREKNQAPETIVAARYANPMAVLTGAPAGEPVSRRPLCAYPRVAHWTGKGSSDQAENYTCRASEADAPAKSNAHAKAGVRAKAKEAA
jgi:feruloyl esterase